MMCPPLRLWIAIRGELAITPRFAVGGDLSLVGGSNNPYTLCQDAEFDANGTVQHPRSRGIRAQLRLLG